MIPTPTLMTFVTLFFGVLIFIFIMLMPVLIELKRPKDAGPRMIIENPTVIQKLQMTSKISIANIESELEFNRINDKKIAEIIAILPSLEA